MSNLLIVDIDDTVVRTDSKIRKHYQGEVTELSSKEFAVDADKDKDGVEYDFSDFSNPVKISNAIKNGKPIFKNIKLINKYCSQGYELAFLTARNNEDAVYKALETFLKSHRDDESVITSLSRELCVAIQDPKYEGMFKSHRHFDMKAEVLDDYCDLFDHVVFIDDDVNNLVAARHLNRDNLKVIRA
jgi:hypothetical protein